LKKGPKAKRLKNNLIVEFNDAESARQAAATLRKLRPFKEWVREITPETRRFCETQYSSPRAFYDQLRARLVEIAERRSVVAVVQLESRK